MNRVPVAVGQSASLLHLVDRVGYQPVRLAMHCVRGVRVPCLDEAEDLPLALVDPVPQAPVRPGDVITARVVVTSVRDDKPITTLATTITNQDGVVVLDGTAVVWRDQAVANSLETQRPRSST
jgi:hypothetical protein